MITISVCMIVKNEEKVLARCLDSLKGLYEELIIVDTGSVDSTKEIAARYTDKIYDYEWISDFSDARNYAFSLASMEYIYSADADEYLDEENRKLFAQVKQVLDPQIEIVQMYYGNQLANGTVYNFDKEYRPKLYKRLRQFVWEEPVHEAVRLSPVIYDSDIVITHLPEDNHAKRDFKLYENLIKKDGRLSKKLYSMYCRELYVSGDEQDFLNAESYFKHIILDTELKPDEVKMAECILAKCAHFRQDVTSFFTMCLHNTADGNGCSELCYELGTFYEEQKDYEEAMLWYFNAANETESIMNIHCGGDWALKKIADCMGVLGDKEQQQYYSMLAREWKTPAV